MSGDGRAVRERRVSLGSGELAIAMSEERAARLTGTGAYQRVARPAARWLYRRARGRDRFASGDAAAAGFVAPDGGDAEHIRELIRGVDWYHTMDLAPGVVTPGRIDHRRQVDLYRLPASMAGMRCLDVATFDGFWAFEMERRGAQVVGLDIERWGDADLPKVMLDEELSEVVHGRTGAGFNVAREIYGSRAERITSSVYDLSPERHGMFDVVFISDVLLHLRDPQLALEKAFSVCRGRLIVGEVYNQFLTGDQHRRVSQFFARVPEIYQTWWLPSPDTLKAMIQVAGFEPVEEHGRFMLESSLDFDVYKIILHAAVPRLHSWRRPEREFSVAVGDVRLGWVPPRSLGRLRPRRAAAAGAAVEPEPPDGGRLFALPDSPAGRRCLVLSPDPPSWSAALEEQGAREVLAIRAEPDVAAIVRGPSPEPGVYALRPENVGRFDLVIVDDALAHLRDPVLALERLYAVCSGSLVLRERHRPQLEGDVECLTEFVAEVPNRPSTWWRPNLDALRMQLRVAGFEPVEEVATAPAGGADGAEAFAVLRAGVPERHSWRIPGYRVPVNPAPEAG